MTDLRFNTLPCGCRTCGCLCDVHAADRIESPCGRHILGFTDTPGMIFALCGASISLEAKYRAQRLAAKPVLPTAEHPLLRGIGVPANHLESASFPPSA